MTISVIFSNFAKKFSWRSSVCMDHRPTNIAVDARLTLDCGVARNVTSGPCSVVGVAAAVTPTFLSIH